MKRHAQKRHGVCRRCRASAQSRRWTDVLKRGRDFAAWRGLVPRQQSTGGKQVLGKISKMGQRDIRRLLIIGAVTLVRAESFRVSRWPF
jgi:transposase